MTTSEVLGTMENLELVSQGKLTKTILELIVNPRTNGLMATKEKKLSFWMTWTDMVVTSWLIT